MVGRGNGQCKRTVAAVSETGRIRGRIGRSGVAGRVDEMPRRTWRFAEVVVGGSFTRGVTSVGRFTPGFNISPFQGFGPDGEFEQ